MNIGIILGVLVAVTFISYEQNRIKKEAERKDKIESFKAEFKLKEPQKIEKIQIPKELKPVVSVNKIKKAKKKS